MLTVVGTRIERSLELPLYSGSADIVQGAGLTYEYEDGEYKAMLGDGGSNNDVFCGIALTSHVLPTTEVVVETVQLSGTTGTTTFTPLTPTTAMFVALEAGTALTYNASPNASQFAITGSTITVHSDNSDDLLTVRYKRSLTAAEAERKFGDGTYLGAVQPSLITDSVTALMGGEFYTDQFAAADNWAAFTGASTLKVTASGLFTMASGATGATVRGHPTKIPTAENTMLGLRIWVS